MPFLVWAFTFCLDWSDHTVPAQQRTCIVDLYNSCKAQQQQKAVNKTNHKTYPICIPSFLYPVAFVTYWLCYATYDRSVNFERTFWRFQIYHITNEMFVLGFLPLPLKRGRIKNQGTSQRCILPVFFLVDLFLPYQYIHQKENWQNAPLCTLLL